MANHDFVSKPIVVDINCVFTADMAKQIEHDFVERRPALPSLVIITPEDTVGSAWVFRI